MLRPVNGLGSQRPGPGGEQDHEQEEKAARHLEEDDVSHSAERPQKSTNTSRDASGGPARSAP